MPKTPVPGLAAPTVLGSAWEGEGGSHGLWALLFSRAHGKPAW